MAQWDLGRARAQICPDLSLTLLIISRLATPANILTITRQPGLVGRPLARRFQPGLLGCRLQSSSVTLYATSSSSPPFCPPLWFGAGTSQTLRPSVFFSFLIFLSIFCHNSDWASTLLFSPLCRRWTHVSCMKVFYAYCVAAAENVAYPGWVWRCCLCLPRWRRTPTVSWRCRSTSAWCGSAQGEKGSHWSGLNTPLCVYEKASVPGDWAASQVHFFQT